MAVRPRIGRHEVDLLTCRTDLALVESRASRARAGRPFSSSSDRFRTGDPRVISSEATIPCSNPPRAPSVPCSTATGPVAGCHRRRRALRGTAAVRTVAGIRGRDHPCFAHGEALGGTRGGRARRRAAARAGRRRRRTRCSCKRATFECAVQPLERKSEAWIAERERWLSASRTAASRSISATSRFTGSSSGRACTWAASGARSRSSLATSRSWRRSDSLAQT